MRADAASRRPASAGFAIARARARRRAGRARSRPTPRRAPTACAELLRPRRPPLPLPVRQLHELRAAVHDRPRRPLRPAADDDGRLRDVRRAAGRSTRTRATAASTRSRTPARTAGRARGCSATAGRRRRRSRWPPRRCCATARSSRSRASAATTSPAAPTTRPRSRALRARKHREDKPFALMVARPRGGARRSSSSTAPSEALLRSPRAADRARAAAAGRRASPPAVAPGCAELGVMLPYSPLHHLLLADAGAPLVMTSGNVSDEPIAYRDDDALERLAGIADAVPRPRPPDPHAHRRLGRARRAPAAPLMLRRSRGYVPGGARAARRRAARRCSPCGAELKSTFCLAQGRARLGRPPHRRPRATSRRCGSFREGIAHFERLFAVEPEVVAHDLHPDYLSTAYALEREGVELVGVQHHHAHLAACLAEHGETRAGGRRDLRRHGLRHRRHGLGRRAAGRRPARLRARRPPVPGARCRAATARCASRGGWRARGCVDARERAAPAPLAGGRRRGAGTPSRGSCADRHRLAADDQRRPPVRRGRRAVRAARRGDLRGPGRDRARGGRATPAERGAYALPADRDGVLDARPPCSRSRATSRAGVPRRRRSRRASTTRVARRHRARVRGRGGARGLDAVVLSGGVFQNRRLLASHGARGSRRAGLRVLVPERLPPNDGGIAYGQAARRRRGTRRTRAMELRLGSSRRSRRSTRGSPACSRRAAARRAGDRVRARAAPRLRPRPPRRGHARWSPRTRRRAARRAARRVVGRWATRRRCWRRVPADRAQVASCPAGSSAARRPASGS